MRQALTPAQIATNHLVDSVRYLGATPDDVLAICASPINLDVTLTPGYAGRDGLAAGESLAVSAPAGEVTITDGFKATCTGWKLYDAAASVVDSGNGNILHLRPPDPSRLPQARMAVRHRDPRDGIRRGRYIHPCRAVGGLSVPRPPSRFLPTRANVSMW
jgi:hypothetical protein